MSTKHYLNKPTLEVLEAQQAANVKEAMDREQRIADCHVEASDCALSMWANASMNGLFRTQLELARNGWKHDFLVLYRHGKRVVGKVVETRFGSKWLIGDEWLPTYWYGDTERRKKNFAAKGFTWVKESLDAHAVQHFGSYVGAPVSTSVAHDERDIIAIFCHPADFPA